MGKRKGHRSHRPPRPEKGRWRTIGILATTIGGVAVVLALNFVNPGRRGGGDDPGLHDHPPGPHGGTVVAIDRDNRFHAEAVFEATGAVNLYTFGRELTDPRPVAARTICAAARGHGNGPEEHAVMLRPWPQPGDPPGTASRFAGRLPPAAWRPHLRLVVWSLRVGGERFRFEIDAAGAPFDDDSAAKAVAAEAALYATPGGKYREDDIRANGDRPAAQKYRGERPAHDDQPAPGERVCPVSRSRADPRFVWVVGGREYRFCCPPCIDEFVATAKERPDAVREPDFYRHQ
ncbi:MAG: hypothetical protein K2X87_21885 [Gemmataceae bacterium]|nr:hypothetical protein [Gemmataceae bacterium]